MPRSTRARRKPKNKKLSKKHLQQFLANISAPSEYSMSSTRTLSSRRYGRSGKKQRLIRDLIDGYISPTQFIRLSTRQLRSSRTAEVVIDGLPSFALAIMVLLLVEHLASAGEETNKSTLSGIAAAVKSFMQNNALIQHLLVAIVAMGKNYVVPLIKNNEDKSKTTEKAAEATGTPTPTTQDQKQEDKKDQG